MNIIIDINHPAHVHMFKNLYFELIKNGHNVSVVAVEKEISILLLDKYNIPFIKLGKNPKSTYGKILLLIFSIFKLFFISIKFKPEIFLSVAGIRSSVVAFLLGKKSFVFDDTEHSTKEIALYKPFATKIFTPDCFLDDLGPKQMRYAGYHELAYLHPNRFTPNPEVLKEIGLTENDKFFVVRFVSWEASHDIGQKGLSIEDKRKLIDLLKPHGKIIISAERELPSEFEEYRMSICPTKMHDLLYYATMYLGEGGTMASEAACLGTYSIYTNSLPSMGYIKEEIEKYNLIFKSIDINEIIAHLNSISFDNVKSESKEKAKKIIEDKIDPTQFLINLIEKESTKNSPKHSK